MFAMEPSLHKNPVINALKVMMWFLLAASIFLSTYYNFKVKTDFNPNDNKTWNDLNKVYKTVWNECPTNIGEVSQKTQYNYIQTYHLIEVLTQEKHVLIYGNNLCPSRANRMLDLHNINNSYQRQRNKQQLQYPSGFTINLSALKRSTVNS